MIELQRAANEAMASDVPGGQSIPFYRACYVEMVEVLSDIGYKWWKKEEINIDKVTLELVDALHFAISDHIAYFHRQYKDSARGTALLINSFTNIYEPGVERVGRNANKVGSSSFAELTLQDMCDQAVYFYINLGRSSVGWIAAILERLEVSPDTVFSYYVAKNTLNMFRDDKGQKSGTYSKMWNVVEDNTYLHEFVKKSLSDGEVLTIDSIRAYLESEFAAQN